MATHHRLENSQVVVVMVPFPAQGHLNQLLHLSHLVASYNIPVHYVSSATHNLQAKARIHSGNHFDIANIHFHDFPTPSFLSPPPNPNASIKFPSHLQPLFEASSQLREPVRNLLRELSPKTRRIVVIHDSLMASVVQDVASIPNAESYNFHSVSAFALFCHCWETLGRPFEVEANILKDLPSNEGCFTAEFIKFISTQFDHIKISSGRLYNTCRVIESPYLDLLAKKVTNNNKQWALGPFNPVTAVSHNKKSCHPCLDWLDKQPQNSVIYVSFGTTTSLSDEQIKELATGLERSEQKFIWVLREADRGDVFEGAGERKLVEVLPKGFEERVEGKGIVVREWAPQLEILGHTSTGGFMSHCGWNSCMESITMGVAMGAWPMHSDQPRNAVLIAKLLKVGVVVKDWARRAELVDSLTIETAVRRLMGSKEGEEIRKRAAEFGREVRKAVEEGGVSRLELDSFIAHITR
ncbi:zeatin O-glucosyltransferase-like [Cornus florida]|uniref:zeatin O-glucosyltransferase-like n=1 Tax=Cornus florida TaxID=4283 RepID=UPI0028A07FA6|nr:zeatin O-glucosyltransferase-like [Cornus florida]